MSLIGTRPPTVDEWEKYELHHRARLAIKPGLTGMWQVSGRSEITDFEKVVKLDTKYISEWSFLLDIKILFKTVLIVLGQKNNDEYESMVQRVYRQITTVDAETKITIATSRSQASAIKNACFLLRYLQYICSFGFDGETALYSEYQMIAGNTK